MGAKKTLGARSVWSIHAVALACAGLCAGQASANNWITPAGGSWADPVNWSPGIPDGVDAVADFSTVDLLGDATVALGTARTVGTLNFGDTDPLTPGGWLLSDATQQTLTLAATNNAPTIFVGNLGAGKAATISSLLSVAANQTVAKTGAGTLIFTNTGNAAVTGTAFYGTLDIQQGTFQVANTGALPSFGPTTVLLNGGTMRFSASANTSRVFSLGTGGGTIAAAAPTAFSGTGAMPLVGNGSRTLTFNAEVAGTYSFSNVIADGPGGATSFVKSGSGALTLNAANTFTGTIAVNGGALNITSFGGTPTGTPATATTYTGGGVSLASGATLNVTRGLSVNFSGPVSGAGNLNVNITNDGNVALPNATYTGSTTVQRGSFNLGSNPAGSNYVLGNTVVTSYGILNLDAADFTGPLGTTGGGVTFAGSGGFANPNAGTRVVALGGTASPTPLQLNVGGFVAGNGTTPTTDFRLKFGAVDASSLGQVDFRNAIDLNGRRLTVTVDGLAQAPGVLSGNITGTGLAAGGLFKFGNASLVLSGANTYTGPTSIVAGNAPTFASAIILGSAGAFSPNTNIQLNGGAAGLTGGVLGLGFADGNFTLGTGNGQVQFTAANSGGFGAYGANRTVTLNGGLTPLVWGTTTSFVPTGQNLILALQNSDATLTFNNSIDVNGAVRSVVVNNGSAAIDAVIAQPIVNSSATAGGLNKLGSGTLALTAANTYTGVTTVTGGTLQLSGNGTFGTGQVTNNSAIVLANTTALAVPNAISGTGTLTQSGSGTTTLSGAQTYTGQTTVTGGTLQTTSQNVLTAAGGLDIQNGSFVLDYTGGPTPAATIRGLLANSFTAGAGVMNTGQIRSTTATLKRGIGYVDNGTGNVTLRATLFGDADLDGGVSINDFNALAGNFGQATGRVWSQGDFDYDGGVSINDFNLLAGNFGQTLPASSEAWAGLIAFAAAHNDMEAFQAITGVPEPTGLGLLAAGATLGLRRRRR